MFPDERFLKALLIVLLVFMLTYLVLAAAFFRSGDFKMGFLCLAWSGLLVLACRWGRVILGNGKDDDYE